MIYEGKKFLLGITKRMKFLLRSYPAIFVRSYSSENRHDFSFKDLLKSVEINKDIHIIFVLFKIFNYLIEKFQNDMLGNPTISRFKINGKFF
jgi:hypothetical protein